MLSKNLKNKIRDKSLAKKFFTILLIFVVITGFIQTLTPLARATSYSYSSGSYSSPGTSYSTGTSYSPGTSYSTGTCGSSYQNSCSTPCTGYTYTPVSTCAHECSFTGQHQCSGTSGRTCGNYDSDYCLEWSSWQNCDPQCFFCGDGTCDSGCGENSTNCSQDCGVSCTNECSSGQHQCSGTSGKTCGNYDSDSCLEWSSWQNCDSQCFSCGDGTCNSGCGENSTNCSQDCGVSCTSHNTKQCYLNDSYWYDSCGVRESKYEECGDDSCLSWSGNYCYLGDVYRQRTCYDRGCAGGFCHSDSYSDRELVERCDSGETCQNGNCVIIADDTRLQVEKTARNLTRGEQIWKETIFASPLDQVQFRIVVTSLGADSLENLILIDNLPAQLDLVENSIRIDGVPTSKNILTGASLKDIDTGEYCRVEFTTAVASASNFNYGLTSLANRSQVSNSQVTDSDTATVKITRSQVAGVSTVATGTGNKWLDYLVLPLVISLAGVFLLRKQFILARKWLNQRKKQALDYRAQQALRKFSSRAR